MKWLVGLGVWLLTLPSWAQGDRTTRAELEAFFERDVRPILVEHCQTCHGARKQEYGLRLDSADGVRLGSEAGPVILPGDPANSSLMQAVRYDRDIKMPPKSKLPAAAIATLEKWIRLGAVWPADATPTATRPGNNLAEAAKQHWAFQPVRLPPVPNVSSRERVATPVDAFILAKLETLGASLSPEADRRTLIRRATFDLHGLPPTPEEVAAFEADSSPTAYRDLVDRLLQSPRYGERWARHWLDVARYSDTKGYVRLNENPRYPASWTYRDYVIRAFNNDLPFDHFVLEQLAADQLAASDDSLKRGGVPAGDASLAALGFLTLGQRFLNSPHDIVDDRIDVVTRGLLGLTVACARCHDHKFDPVSTRDYYSLHGIFMSSVEPHIPPLIVTATEQPKFAGYLEELRQRADKLDAYLREQQAALGAGFRQRFSEYLLVADKEPVQANFLAVMFLIDARKDLNPVMIQRWARFLERTRKRHDPVFAPWHALVREAASPDTFAARAKVVMAPGSSPREADKRLNAVVVAELLKAVPADLKQVADTYARLLAETEARWKEAQRRDSTVSKLPEADWEELRQSLLGPEAPLTFGTSDVEEFLFVDATLQQQLHAQQRQVLDWIGSPQAAPHAMSLVDAKQPADSRVLVRGNASQPGEVAPRRWLSALTRGEPVALQEGSGRLQLARQIASPDNPLTARVLVNRVWQHHFGAGLVKTPSDFGLRGEPPSHPELLDYLASTFMARQWSLKQLHREILLSSTYRQRAASPLASDNSSDRAALDPENQYWSRWSRRRLDWESLRDAMLAVSGQLDLTMGGPSVNLLSPPFSGRRSVYGFIDRQSLPSELRTFDFAPPDVSAPQRHQTTVPQQALFLLNSPFIEQQVRQLAKRLDQDATLTTRQRIGLAYRLLFCREPDAPEVAAAETYLASSNEKADGSRFSPWQEFLQVLLLSNEFVFVD